MKFCYAAQYDDGSKEHLLYLSEKSSSNKYNNYQLLSFQNF